MGSFLEWIPRGRGIRSGLVIVAGAFMACRQGPPPSEPARGYLEPSVSQQNGWTLLDNTGPAETLLIYNDPPRMKRGCSSWLVTPPNRAAPPRRVISSTSTSRPSVQGTHSYGSTMPRPERRRPSDRRLGPRTPSSASWSTRGGPRDGPTAPPSSPRRCGPSWSRSTRRGTRCG